MGLSIKGKPNGSIGKYKARKAGKDFTQKYEINYGETYFQMIRPETFKILRHSLALWKDIRQWDVGAAYVQVPLKHDIYISDINEDGKTEY